MKTKGVAVGLLVLGLFLVGTVGPGPAVAAEEEQPAPPEGMVLIPAGSFLMGDAFNEGSSDERPVHTVIVSAFYMDAYEVTKALWDEVAEWAEVHGYDIRVASTLGAGQAYPVIYVSWYAAVKWANARSEKEGLTPCYYTDETLSTVYRTGRVDVANEWVKWTANGYRLPTEAEWEKAARGELVGARYPWGDDIACTQANYWGSGGGCVGSWAPVGSYAPNGYGLYDMAANVWECCWDWYSSGYYASSPGTDPRGPGSGSGRVLRGGSWRDYAGGCRVAVRNFNVRPGFEGPYLGFRLVRTAP